MCTRVVGEFPFAFQIASSADVWRPLGVPVVMVGASTMTFSTTLIQQSGDAQVIPI